MQVELLDLLVTVGSTVLVLGIDSLHDSHDPELVV